MNKRRTRTGKRLVERRRFQLRAERNARMHQEPLRQHRRFFIVYDPRSEMLERDFVLPDAEQRYHGPLPPAVRLPSV